MRNFVLVILMAFAMLSCSGRNPMSPDGTPQPDRQGMAFQTALEAFAGTVLSPSVDADSGEVLNGPTTANPGTPWNDTNGNHWGIVTSLVTTQGPPLQHLIRFRKLKTDAFGAESLGTNTYSLPVAIGVNETRLPRVAACYFPAHGGDFPSDPFIEVAIVYQWWSDANQDWDIVVRRLRFDNPTADWDLQAPTPLGADETWPDSTHYNIEPDIAYDPNTGDLYVISATYTAPGESHLFIMKGPRNYEDWHRIGLPPNWQWNFPILAQKDQTWNPPAPHNSFQPRIDVGQVNFGSYQSDQWMVGIAYTGWIQLIGWHIRVNYWATSESGQNNYCKNDIGWDDGVFGLFPAGVASIDIGPPDSDHAAIAWMQAKSDDWANVTVMYADCKQGGLVSLGRLNPDAHWGAACSAFPSVAVHEYLGGNNYRSSISFLGSTNYVSAQWIPEAVHADTAPGSIAVTFSDPPISVPGTDSAVGKWDSGTTVEHYFGLSTALTVYANNYWMVWSAYDPTSSAGGPTSVYAAFGNTN